MPQKIFKMINKQSKEPLSNRAIKLKMKGYELFIKTGIDGIFYLNTHTNPKEIDIYPKGLLIENIDNNTESKNIVFKTKNNTNVIEVEE